MLSSLRPATMTATETLCFVLLPQFSMLGLLSAIEPLRAANRFHADAYRWRLLSRDGQSVCASNGMELQVQGCWGDADHATTVLVVAGFNPLAHCTPALLGWLRQLDRQAVALGGIDTGSFILAEAGLYRQQRLTLHWEAVPAFRERYPQLKASQELYELDGLRLSSAGGTASIDMMLELIARRHGHALAIQVSEQFVLGRIRDKKDHQRLQVSERYGVHNHKLVHAISLMESQLEQPYSCDALAGQVGITRRQLERLFRAQLDDTPSGFYLQLRLQGARRLLRQSELNIMEISVACGFDSASYFARAYRKLFGCAPSLDRSEPHASN